MTELNRPKYYKPYKGHRISYEIWGWKRYFITFSVGTVEIQINKWHNNINERENSNG